MTDDTVTLTIEDEETVDELEVPSKLFDMVREDDVSDARVVGDIAMMGLAQRIHGAVHHMEGEVDDDVAAVDELTMELFEERFGQSFAELTGHGH
jgi:hypothetical protein